MARRDRVRDRAGGRCEFCRLPDSLAPWPPFHVDHIVPEQHGGASDESNFAWTCQRCNLRKGTNLAGIDPDSRARTGLFNPRSDRWSDHFRFDGPAVTGQSAIGRTTVWLLDMNAPRRLELRSELMRSGQWPTIGD